MKTPAQRAAKRNARENRDKETTWHCRNCGERHGYGSRCPYLWRNMTAGVLVRHDSEMGRAIRVSLL